MRLASNFWSSASLSTAFFALATLLAWTTAAFLFILLKRAPLTHDAPVTTYYATLCTLLPWLAGTLFWIKVRKRAKLGIADRDATSFCYNIIFILLCTAYVAMVSIQTVVLWVLTGGSGR